MNVRFLGAHNCESQSSKCISLLIDNALVVDAGGLTSSLSFAAQEEIKAILLTHHHYDHIKDVPAIAINLFLRGKTISIYSTQSVYDAIVTHLLNDKLYPNFLKQPPENPTVKFTILEPYRTEQVGCYSILAIPVKHTYLSVGYRITSGDGKELFCITDTGPGLADCWERISPQLLIIPVTGSNKYEKFAGETGHLTPSLLKQELASFRKIKGYLPRVITIHMNPMLEKEIEAEIAAVSQDLNGQITLAYEGMQALV